MAASLYCHLALVQYSSRCPFLYSPEFIHSPVVTMGLDEFVNETRYESASIDTDLASIADDVWPDMWMGNKAPKYRQMVLRQFLERNGLPPRRTEGHSFSQNETRLLRAWGDVSEVADVSENTIRKCVLRMYDGDEISSEDEDSDAPTLPDQFLNDLEVIEEKWEKEK